MNDSRTLSAYVHRCKAQEVEIDRLHAALRIQRELCVVYADGWRANYDECGREAAQQPDCATEEALARCEDDTVRLVQMCDELKAANTELGEGYHRAANERDQWKAEALGRREQMAEMSRQLTELHNLRLAIAGVEENHRDG